MRENPPKSPSPGPVSKDMSSADSEQPSREASVPVAPLQSSVHGSGQGSVHSSGQGSVNELELHSAMAEFVMKYFRCDRRLIVRLFVVI